ncbi:GIY-YIG nuclease family protein [Hymenobacter terrestris]|uniref:GIY-YIG nuclease family protein n=1 Tax=Hymenobacter terrestris TaxID=2748310 RepID=A0ABX2PZD3_9BACT|nr:GIY-YIG nuclease family protein [Hymenobacter terrestris]NVO84035.1 GIY-YIG nuclease family protein [Hymenobacter terrestris]
MKTYYVYLLTNKNKTVLYIGVTNDLQRRVGEHKVGLHPGFTKKYNLHYLVYFESYPDIKAAIAREKQLKAGSRQKKEALIMAENPEWLDLAADF